MFNAELVFEYKTATFTILRKHNTKTTISDIQYASEDLNKSYNSDTRILDVLGHDFSPIWDDF